MDYARLTGAFEMGDPTSSSPRLETSAINRQALTKSRTSLFSSTE